MQLVNSALGFLGIAPRRREVEGSDSSSARTQLQRAITMLARVRAAKKNARGPKARKMLAQREAMLKRRIIRLKARVRQQGSQVDDTLDITTQAAPEAAESDFVEAPDENLSGMLDGFVARTWTWKGLLVAGLIGAVAARRLWK